MATNTAVTDYLRLPVPRFFEIWQAICSVYERKARKKD